MKNKKNLVALLLVFVLCAVCLPTMALASEVDFDSSDSLESQLPDDAIILYQDENAILYQSNEATVSPREVSGENNYGYAWVPKSGISGTFPVKNTCSGKTGVTWKVEASDPNDYAQIYMMAPGNLLVLKTKAVHPKDGDVHLTLDNAVVGTYTVGYVATKNTNGMRIMCWTYQ